MLPASPAISTPSFRGLIGVARRDITPPIGIYSRCWAAAKHDTATGVHRPLTLTCLTFQSAPDTQPLVLMSLDLMTWRSKPDEWSVRGHILESLRLPSERLLLCLTHTHASPAVQLANSHKPGGHLIAPYLDQLRTAAVDAANMALKNATPATLTWRYGHCELATNRDFAEPGTARLICGYNPNVPADDTLLVGRITDATGATRATIVNYACHPTTLAWENTLLSPDYVGALRETIESHTNGSPCLFLQGASGELAPAEQYVADPAIADRHGRHLAFATLATLESMGPASTTLHYEGVHESGAPLALWRRRPMEGPISLSAQIVPTELPLKPADPEPANPSDPVAKEKLARRQAIRQIVGDGPVAQMPLYFWRLGDSILLGQQNEAYSQFQTQLRAAHPTTPIAVINLANGSGGYLPPVGLYGSNCYQVSHSPFAQGALENLISTAIVAIQKEPVVQ